MSELLTVRLSVELQHELKSIAKELDIDKSELVRNLLTIGIKEKKIEQAVKLYTGKKISLWKAARIAGISLWEMMEILKARKIEIQYGMEELRDDLTALEEPV